MLLLRLLAISLVLITNTWLLNPVRSDAIGRHKRAMAQRADRELSRLAGEPCTVSGAPRSRRQIRSLSPSQHRPPAARTRTHTSRGEPYNTAKSALAVCAGGCRFETGGQLRGEQEKENWTGTGDRDSLAKSGGGQSHERPASDQTETPFASNATPRRSPHGEAAGKLPLAARLARSLRATSPPALSLATETTVPTDKVPLNSSADPAGTQQVPQKQQDDGDQQSAPETLEDVSGEDYSGEVDAADSPASVSVGSAAPWGSPVPMVPASWMTALYFSGRREQLRQKPTAGFDLPRSQFSVELWVKPEGGQSNPAVIAGG